MKVIGIILLVLVVAFTVFEIVGIIRDIQAKKRKIRENEDIKE